MSRSFFFVEIKEKGSSTNAKHVSIYPSNWLIKKSPNSRLFNNNRNRNRYSRGSSQIYKENRIYGNLAIFLQLLEHVHLDLESLKINPEIHYKTMATKLISGSLKD